MTYVSRGGHKLRHALDIFNIDPAGLICADLGCSTGGFTDVLLQAGAARVYSVDTGYGVLDWTLRNDSRVVVMERTNAMHVVLPEAVAIVVIDAGWTRQSRILPAALSLLSAQGTVVSLVKPHYEYDAAALRKTKGILPQERLAEVMDRVRSEIVESGFDILGETPSPILGAKGNREILVHLRPTPAARA